MKKLSLLMIMFLFAAAGTARAASPWMETQGTWGDKAKAKADFGIKNIFAGWTEIFNETREDYAVAKSPVDGLKGLGRGTVYAIADTLGGALHVITFPLVSVDVPLPENGVSF